MKKQTAFIEAASSETIENVEAKYKKIKDTNDYVVNLSIGFCDYLTSDCHYKKINIFSSRYLPTSYWRDVAFEINRGWYPLL